MTSKERVLRAVALGEPDRPPEDVAVETRRVTDILTLGGGAIIAPCHVVQMDVPPGNLEAMRDAVWGRALAVYATN